MNPLSTILLLIIRTIRPLLGPSLCRYSVGCTEFACQQLRTQNLVCALSNIMKRVLSCNPFTSP